LIQMFWSLKTDGFHLWKSMTHSWRIKIERFQPWKSIINKGSGIILRPLSAHRKSQGVGLPIVWSSNEERETLECPSRLWDKLHNCALISTFPLSWGISSCIFRLSQFRTNPIIGVVSEWGWPEYPDPG
jgi:hypothetical protein